MKKIYVDSMLGEVAKWLRLFGFYVEYIPSEICDKTIISTLKKDRDIIFITSDKKLAEISKRKMIETIFIDNRKNLIDKLVTVLEALDVRKVDIFKSRCPFCNSELVRIQGQEEFLKIIKESIVKTVYKREFEPYFYCRKCKKIYWKGRMWKNMERTIKKINQVLENNGG